MPRVINKTTNSNKLQRELLGYIEDISQKPVAKENLCKLMSCIDLTNLSLGVSEKDISQLCNKVVKLPEKITGLSNVASVCVYPVFATVVSGILKGSLVKTTAVAGGFPSSLTFGEIKFMEVKKVIESGADEIDVVMEVGKLATAREIEIADELIEIRRLSSNKILKIILEVSLIKDPSLIKHAAAVALDSGADFVKTSTGKEGSVASIEAALFMCEAIMAYNKKSGKKKGIKVSGGITEINDAMRYLLLVENYMGKDWCGPNLFRIGASRLANNIVNSFIEFQKGKAAQLSYF